MLEARDEGLINAPYLLLTEPQRASGMSTIHQEALMTPKLKRTLALALAGGTLAIGVPAALAAGGGDDAGSTAAPSTQIQDQQQRAPRGDARPDRGDCPEHDGGAGSSSDSGSSNPDTAL
jgi:hypothetical protein